MRTASRKVRACKYLPVVMRQLCRSVNAANSARALLAALLLFIAAGAHASPYVPDDDSMVLDRARIAAGDPLSRELKSLKREYASSPANLQLALKLAERYIAATRSTADPRYLGYAEATLAPWSKQDNPPAPVLLLRATLRQSAHDFAGALADLDRSLALDSRRAQAWLTLATVQNVQAHYRDAAQSCARLAPLTGELVTVACLAQVGSVAGQAKDAYRALQLVSGRNPARSAADRVWALTLLGEMAARLGLTADADAYFRQATKAAGPVGDAYLKGAYADFLLDAGRAREVLALLANDVAADPLLLRLALAEQALGLDARAHTDMLRARFAAARMRGDTVHRREESRFVLRLMHDPGRALEIATANWQVQREPADARVLLEAARASGDPASAREALAWMRENHVEDFELGKLAAGFTARAVPAGFSVKP